MSVTTDLGLHAGLNASRGLSMLMALKAGMDAAADRREDRRRAGVESVRELAVRLQDARRTEGQAISVAEQLAAENVALQAERNDLWEALRATADRAARAEAAVLEAAAIARARRLQA
ncbi:MULTISPECIES: hypothetical protein [unclassified Methylobacterium]|jgi:predicted transcriptional regulator|uniref:hypothetical protein n=1 Tax=unclassified Methylobacterium TaxID=2615210 RepID=UPI00135259FF|nr:hypothetical protein [Methylobacterium sp. 2A]MWV22466.1 hypothetical protein [Methylobacterium sp. 2A]